MTAPTSTLEQSLGISQGDVILASAITLALADLRANPWLLDFIWVSLPKDEATSRLYGQATAEQAKKWFLHTHIPVRMAWNLDHVQAPCISVGLGQFSETEFTLGDEHYQPRENWDLTWPVLAEFQPTFVDTVAGVIGVPEDLDFVLAPAQVLVSVDGVEAEIVGVTDTEVTVAPGTTGNWTTIRVHGQKPSQVIHWESVNVRESYTVGVHVQGESEHCLFLYNILMFALLRYKASLIEARGLERTTLSVTSLELDRSFENEVTWSRYVSVSGFMRQSWPAAVNPRITGVEVLPEFDVSG